jgi:hypothetical protein
MNASTVVVAMYEHRYGQDVRVFQTREKALQWADEIAEEYWAEMTDNAPKPEDFLEQYWRIAGDGMRHESFTLETLPIEA